MPVPEKSDVPPSGHPPAVVLLSGGLDSATTMALARDAGFDVYALTFRYGQRHAVEVAAAARVAEALGAVDQCVVDIDLRAFGGSALTSSLPVPKSSALKDHAGGIPVTYVPARNTIFLSFALAYAETLRATDIFVGVNAVDYSGYPDCRPEYIRAFQSLANLATRSAVEGQPYTIHAPLIQWTKAEIIACGRQLGVDYGLTTSCYDPDAGGGACGACDACVLRQRGFAQLGLDDPAAARNEDRV